MFKSYVELPAAQLHTIFFSFKTANFFFKSKKSCLKKNSHNFFLFPFDSVAFRKFYLQTKMKNCPKKFTKHFIIPFSSKLTFQDTKLF